MLDVALISREAVQIHNYFESLFYLLVTLFLLLSVVIEYFNLPLGGVPSIGPLVGRILIAAILLHTYPELAKIVADVTDGVAKHLGDMNQFKVVLGRMGEKLHEFSWSWVSVKGSVILAISFLSFFLLYFSVHVAQAFLLYTFTLLYVFSPLLIAFFVLPQTSGATKALFRALIEACFWKIVWAVLATLLWSTGVGEITKHTNLLTATCFNLILAGSLLLTPFVVHALTSHGLTSMTGTFGAIAVGGMTTLTPAKVVHATSATGKKAYNGTLSTLDRATEKRFPRVNRVIKKAPRIGPEKKEIKK